MVGKEECGDGLGKGIGWTSVTESFEDEGIEFVNWNFGQKGKVVGFRRHKC